MFVYSKPRLKFQPCVKMLSPEVWNFKPPPYSVLNNFCESEEEIFRRTQLQYFNHHVSIILPNTVKAPNDLVKMILEDSQYYRINKVKAAEFFKQDFVDLFMKKGQLTTISVHEFPEQNSLSIIPCGKVILSLSQSSFQELGIQGAFTGNSSSCLKKYFVNLDLSSDSNETKKKCEQMHKKLALHHNLCFDVVLAWQPEVPNICPSSIACYFAKKGYFVKTCYVSCKQKLKYNVAVPACEDESDVADLIEWLGAFGLDCDMSNDSFISTLKCPEKNQILGQVLHLSFTGLLTQNRLQKIIPEINLYTKARSSNMWTSMSIQAFQNSILNVKNKQLFLSEGNSQCTLIFRWNHPFIINVFQDKTK